MGRDFLEGFSKKLAKKQSEPEPLPLYKQYKQSLLLQKEGKREKPAVVKKEKPLISEKSAKTKKPVNRVQEKQKVKGNPGVPVEIAVCSLKTGCGCSHIAMAMEHHLAGRGKRSCVVEESWQDFSEHGAFDYIINDFGCIKALDGAEERELKRAGIKLMLCVYEDSYMMQLADFIRRERDSLKRWYFLFNFVPSNKKKEVEALMEDYPYCFLPLFDEEGKEVGKIFRNII